VFSFLAFNTMIFFVLSLLRSVELSVGVGFGLFAIFSVLNYRTTEMSIREMTYLFTLIALPVMNAFLLASGGDGLLQVLAGNAAVVLLWTATRCRDSAALRGAADEREHLGFRPLQVVEREGVGVGLLGVRAAGRPVDLDRVALGILEVDTQAHAMVEGDRRGDATRLCVGTEGAQCGQALHLERDVPPLRVGAQGQHGKRGVRRLPEEDERAQARDRPRHGGLPAQEALVETGQRRWILRGDSNVAKPDGHSHGQILL
jgi:hypothetical protein